MRFAGPGVPLLFWVVRTARVSILVPTFNNPSCLERIARDVIARTRDPYELIVIDNASEPGSVEETYGRLQRDPHVQVIRMASNGYYWPAINAGIRASAEDTRYYLALNDDVILLGPDWLERLVSRMEEDQDVGIVGDFQATGAGPLGGWVDGWCALIRRSLVDRIGLFDEKKYPFHYGFVDFQYRAFRCGYSQRDIKAPGDTRDHVQGIAHHLRGATIRQGNLTARERRRLLKTPTQLLYILIRHLYFRAAVREALRLALSRIRSR